MFPIWQSEKMLFLYYFVTQLMYFNGIKQKHIGNQNIISAYYIWKNLPDGNSPIG